jgi:ABC-type polysaccharide/polyol phosphate transport system ATPase subunit
MPPNAVEVRNVSKRYELGLSVSGETLRDVVSGWFRPSTRHRRPARDEIWSLRDVSFDLVEGGALGIIGRNGAGKSTLLKVLTRITEPTSGMSRTRGRVASLLEVGTGFHGELTGRENVFLNGAILGMTRRDVGRRYDAIVDFAGVERFMETPVKRYSSGMYLRLAFSVAAHLEPDVLIVDEVLAVGDADFQRRCIGKMSDVESEGRTVVFVSHDLSAVAKLCPRVIWLESGVVERDGDATEVIGSYLRAVTTSATTRHRSISGDVVSIHEVLVRDATGQPTEVLHREQPFTIDVKYSLHERVPGFDVAIYLTNGRGERAIDEALSDFVSPRPENPGTYVASLSVAPLLNVGDYSIGIWAGSPGTTYLDEDRIWRVQLEGSTKGRPDRVVELRAPWAVREIESNGS